MFEVEKPRRFHYEPRFYDPEKEKWEALKKKYAIEQEKKEAAQAATQADGDGEGELQYFQQRVSEIDKEERSRKQQLSWKDLFRKREMPKFNYQPRFDSQTQQRQDAAGPDASESAPENLTEKYRQSKHQIKIRRRFDISDTEYFKPISGTKIILYCFVVFLLVTLIIAF